MRAIVFWLTFWLTGAAPLSAVPGEHPFESDSTRIPALRTGGNCVIRGATVHSAVGPSVLADVLVQEGDIAAIGSVEDGSGVVLR